MTPIDVLVAVWSEHDRQCLLRPNYAGKDANGRDRWRTNNAVPTDTVTRRLEDAFAKVAADAGCTTMVLRAHLTQCPRDADEVRSRIDAMKAELS